MDVERAREDVVVAGTAAGTTIAIALLSGFGVVADVGPLPMLAPLFVYFGYLFSRKSDPYGAWDVPQNWALAAVLVGGLVLASTLI